MQAGRTGQWTGPFISTGSENAVSWISKGRPVRSGRGRRQLRHADLVRHDVAAGVVGPQHALLAKTGRATYEPVDDAEAMDAFRLLSRTEGIMPAIESAHAVAGARRLGLRLAETDPDTRPLIVVNLSGRGDKDVDTAMAYFGIRGVADRSTGALK